MIMKIPRQSERRARFQAAFQKMPLWETWTTEDGKVSGTYKMVDGHLKLVDISATRHHCKVVPRSTRRSMARDLSKRQYRATHNL
jgi:carbohydrate-binding DOMON domain-containing protein